MSLINLAQPRGHRLGGLPCTVCTALADLPPAEAAALIQMLSDVTWRYSVLEAALAGEGLTLGQGALARHARGQCAARTKLR